MNDSLSAKHVKSGLGVLALFFVVLPIASFALPDVSESPSHITFEELIAQIDKEITTNLAHSDTLKQEFLELQKTHGLSDREKIYQEFLRVRVAFEATRDSGLWQLRWAVTNREPNSDAIWRQWAYAQKPLYKNEILAEATAVAECDELSALFAFVVRSLGVKNVGLFWPTWNHTVAVWTSEDASGKPVRIVIPTSQIFLSANATLGTDEFDPYRQRTIYPYDRQDVPKHYKIPIHIAEMMIEQVKKFGGHSSSYLQTRRNRLSNRFGGS